MTNPTYLNVDYVKQEIASAGQLTVKQLVELSGKAETTVRKALKQLVDEYMVVKIDDVKPAAYRLPTEAEVAEVDLDPVDDEPEYGVSHPIALDEDAEAKLDEIMESITTEPAPVKTSKSKKVAHTDVPDEYNLVVRVNGQEMPVTTAYAALVDPPTFATAGDAYAWLNTVLDNPDRDHSPEEIAGAYYATVADHLERLYDAGDITRGVWYGRTFRLRRTLIGSGKGTASARPAKATSDK